MSKLLIIEREIINGIKKLLVEKVNEITSEIEIFLPVIEFGNYRDKNTIVPEITITECELTEKERIIRQSAYLITIKIDFDDDRDGELNSYVYSGAISRAIYEKPVIDGVNGRLTVVKKEYNNSKKANNGETRELVVTVRAVIEETI